jgi:hypothetical protein
MAIPNRRTRVVGGTTVFFWSDPTTGTDEPIAFAEQTQVFGVQPVAPSEVIQPLNALRPVEIVTPIAHTNGRIVLTLTDLYNQAVWQRLAGLAGSNDIVDIMSHVAQLDNGIKISKWVFPPAGIGGSEFDTGTYLETFHNCVVTRVQDDETVTVQTMHINKEMELWFTYSLKHWIRTGPRRLFVENDQT